MEVAYKNSFLRIFRKLDHTLQTEAKAKIESFKDRRNHKNLRVHPLRGKLSGCYAFSVNARMRIIFAYEDHKKVAVLLSIGDHDVYR